MMTSASGFWYMVPRFAHEIKAVAVRKETSMYLYLTGGRRALKQGLDKYFPTYELARDYLVRSRTAQRDAYAQALEEAEKALTIVYALPETQNMVKT
jgi:hypothetical protein